MPRMARVFNGEPIVGRIMNRVELLTEPWRLSHTMPRRVRQLAHINETSFASALGPAPAVVSLTTYGPRFTNVHLAIESVVSGTLRPRRIVLWLDDPGLLGNPTAGLRRLVDRGLEIRAAAPLGPHKKYYPAVQEAMTEAGELLVTADDDTIYPDYWLEKLLKSARRSPGTVQCYRAHTVLVRDGRVEPYRDWRPCWTTTPALRYFATGGCGVAYPPAMIDALRDAGSAFLECAPKADDVWLHRVAVDAMIPIGQVARRPRYFPALPGSQSVGLYQSNAVEGHNDSQIAATYTSTTIGLIASDIEASRSRSRPATSVGAA